jgi:aminoglycoside 3'-phosphotransferase II
VELQSVRTPVLIGKSGAEVFRVRREDGAEWIEKLGSSSDITLEVSVLNWCRTRLPVATVLNTRPGFVAMSVLPGVNLTEVSRDNAVAMVREALRVIHSVPIDDCVLQASWTARLIEAERRVEAGLVDETDFDDENRGRSAIDILSELISLPVPPIDVLCFTHGDACLPNFLTDGKRLTGIVDLSRAGIAAPGAGLGVSLTQRA